MKNKELQNLPLHRKYRPQSFKEIYGNDELLEALEVKIEEGKTTTFMLNGLRGCGKTTIARIMSKELGGIGDDIHEYNISDVGLKDFAREIIKDARYNSLYGGSKVYIFDEAQDSQASKGFQNAMLKILEEPPPKVFFIICTTDPQKLIQTLKSRCTQFEVKPLFKETMMKFLSDICEKEEVGDFPKNILNEIAKKTDGIPREALVLLDKVIDLDDDKALNIIKNYNIDTDDPNIRELCSLLLDGNAKWKTVASILKKIKENPETVRRAIIGNFNLRMLNGGGETVSNIGSLFEENFYDSGKFGLTNACYMAIKYMEDK